MLWIIVFHSGTSFGITTSCFSCGATQNLEKTKQNCLKTWWVCESYQILNIMVLTGSHLQSMAKSQSPLIFKIPISSPINKTIIRRYLVKGKSTYPLQQQVNHRRMDSASLFLSLYNWLPQTKNNSISKINLLVRQSAYNQAPYRHFGAQEKRNSDQKPF